MNWKNISFYKSLSLVIALCGIFSFTAIGQIRDTINTGCQIRTKASMPGDFVYYWYDSAGNLKFDSVPLLSLNSYPDEAKTYYNVNLYGEVGFCFVPMKASKTTNEHDGSIMVLKETLTSTSKINKNVYLNIGTTVQSLVFPWTTWQLLERTDHANRNLRYLKFLLSGIVLGKNQKGQKVTMLDYASTLLFSNDDLKENIKRSVDLVRWQTNSKVSYIPWFHSPRDKRNKLTLKSLEIFVIHKLGPKDSPRTFVAKFYNASRT